MTIKTLVLTAFFCGAFLVGSTQDFYAHKVPMLQGDTLDCTKLKGIKVLVMAGVPAGADSSYEAFKAFAASNPGLVILGLLQQAGNSSSLAFNKQIASLYEGTSIKLVLPSELSKAGRGAQLPLVQWLTHKELNRHFDRDANEAGTRFFIDETGRLYAVIGPQAPWGSPVMNKILEAKPPLQAQ